MNLSDERIDLTKAKRIEPHPPLPHLRIRLDLRRTSLKETRSTSSPSQGNPSVT